MERQGLLTAAPGSVPMQACGWRVTLRPTVLGWHVSSRQPRPAHSGCCNTFNMGQIA